MSMIANENIVNGSGVTIDVADVSKWYGSVVAVNEVAFKVTPGITALLGPNGAGKTTMLHMIAGLARCSEGDVQVLDEPVRGNPGIYTRLGFMSEHEAVYGFQTGRRFVEMSAQLHGLDAIEAAAKKAIDIVGLADVQDRPLKGYSRGMRQRMRLAASIVHEPQVMILDEPLNGTDPRQRIEFQDVMRRLAREGKTILISSHILEEVETLADRILLMVSGKLAAAGDFRAIREKLDGLAYRVRIVVDAPRAMAAALVAMEEVESVGVEEDQSLIVLCRNVGPIQIAIPELAKSNGIRLLRVEPIDDSLEALFGYLVDR
ncbi:MAG: ABC transporter ATP-binding protein [SAR202 cluster bacterium]|jgi:ABC-2 type transport system ATP-binding protein|nr:ABC transporter ATP-binding protein [SAR202 cluster bacterium]MDP6301854.1 ABC transporter ATP-binding protein [SAR202 cluster bacterium]MDP7104179.1 ABC transporter ATP-binding protein [SAR202 cluster bacterium]MDP7225826.1 ABC transporter ATP-binding protein [SAR202 cluster bacterium]MDP7413683.1 ABC transporter ATP-binding protein [SAR202 cluster bacterium]